MKGFIYKTTNVVNGKSYIGLCSDPKRFSYYLGSGVVLRQAIDKYGVDNFTREILEECDTEEELQDAEKRWISKFDAVNSPNFYNLHEGGKGGYIHKKPGTMSKPMKKYWSDLTNDQREKRLGNFGRNYDKSGENNPMYGRSIVTEKRLRWYTNGEKTIYVTEGTQPKGFIKGRKIK